MTSRSVREESIAARTHALSVEDELVGVANRASRGHLRLSDAPSEGVRSITIEAPSVDANSFIEVEAVVANAGAGTVAEVLTIGALSLRYAFAGSNVNSEARNAFGAAVYVS